MSFISASLLAEPPLISLLDEPDHPSISASSNLSPGRNNSNRLISMQSTPTKDLMDFEEQSPADKLYTEIYQKNLQKFLSFSGLHFKKVARNDPGQQGVVIPSLIDEQISIDGLNRGNTVGGKDSAVTSLIDKVCIDGLGEEGRKAAAIYANEKSGPAARLKDEAKQTVGRDVQRSEQLLILSDKVTELVTQNVDFGSPSSSRASSEHSGVQFVRTDPIVDFVAVSQPLSKAEMVTDVEGMHFPLANEDSTTNNQTPPDCAAGLSDVIPRDSDYLAGESSSSEEEVKTTKRVLSTGSTTTATRSHVTSTHRRLVRINLPYDTLHTMQGDPRFDGYCHAWVRRPDFCKFGVNCNFIHDYPMSLVEEFGVIAVYIGPDGKEMKGAEEFLKLEDIFVKPKWTRLDQGAKIGSPGCYNENCRDFIGKDCKHGEKCWYKHPKTVVENGKWVTKDVRQLIDGEFRVYNDLDEKEKIEIGDGFWGDRQSSISPQGSLRSQMRPRVSPSRSSTSTMQKRERVDIVKEFSTQKGSGRVIEKAVEFQSDNTFDSEEANEIDIDSSTTEGPYYPGSASAARAAAANHAKSILANRSMPKTSSSREQVPKDLLLDIQSTPTEVAVTKVKSSPTFTASPRSSKSNTSAGYNYWGDARSHAPKLLDIEPTTRQATVANTKASSTIVAPSKPSKSNTSASYNYWGDENAADDGADYWKNATPAPVSRVSRRQHAMASEAMTYAQLFSNGSHKTSHTTRAFVMPPQPIASNRETGSRHFRAKQASQAKEKPKDTLIDIFQPAEPTRTTKKAGTPIGRKESIFDDPKVINGGGGHKISDPDADWAKTLKVMLAQKCTPIDWSNIQREPKLNTLIEFEL